MGYIMGVDRGGTKTVAAIADCHGNLCAVKNSMDIPSLRRSKDGLEQVTVTVQHVLTDAGLNEKDIDWCTIGYSGVDWDFEAADYQERFRLSTGLPQITVINDCLGAMAVDTRANGIICIGTGLNISLKNHLGNSFTYGYFISSEDTGGSALGQKALDLVCDAYTGVGPKTILTDWTLKEINRRFNYTLQSVPELMIATTTGSPSIPWLDIHVKEFAPLLLAAANAGDVPAIEVIKKFSQRLSRYIVAAAERLNMKEEPLNLLFSGGIMKNGSLILKQTSSILAEIFPHCTCKLADLEPVCGDLLLALKALHAEDIVQTRLMESCISHQLTLIDTAAKSGERK